MKHTLDRTEIVERIGSVRHCSQIVAGQWIEELGLDEKTTIKMMGPFGGGGFHGEMCGAVAGALAVIGAIYGNYEYGDAEQNMQMVMKVNEFEAKFKEKFGTIVCRELLEEYDLDFSREGDFQRALETTAFVDSCPDYVKGALDILDEILS